MREETIKIIQKTRIIAIVRELPITLLEKLAQALWEGGIRLLEITFDQRNPDSWENTAEAIELISQRFAGKLLPGAGTVMTLEQLQLAYEAKAQYIISPNTDPEIIRATKMLGLTSLPGAMSPTEAVNAWNAGADFVKVFPVGSLSADYIKALKGPLHHIPLLAVGGVNEKNATDFIKAGASGVGVGGNLVNRQWLENNEMDKITALAREYVQAVNVQ